MPEVGSLSSLKTQLVERDALLAEVAEWREKGKPYEGIDDFQEDSIRRIVQRTEHEVNILTQKVAANVECRKSLG